MPPSPATPVPADSIAAFLAQHSPPVKLVRTSLYIPAAPRQPSHWAELPLDLLTSVCHFLSSWRDLLRLSRVHSLLHAHILSIGAAGSEKHWQASCWAYVEAVKVTQQVDDVFVNDRRLQLRARSQKTLPSPSSSSTHLPGPRYLPFDPDIVDLFFSLASPPSTSSSSSFSSSSFVSAPQLEQLQAALSRLGYRSQGRHALSLLRSGRAAWTASTFFTEVSPLHASFFSTLRLVPRLRYQSEATHAASFLFSLGLFRSLRHLALTFLRAPTTRGREEDSAAIRVLRRTAHHALSRLHSLRTLELVDYPAVVSAQTLLPLSLVHLRAGDAVVAGLLSSPELAGSALSQSLVSLTYGSFVDYPSLPFHFPALRHLTRWHLSISDVVRQPAQLLPLPDTLRVRPARLQSLHGSLEFVDRSLSNDRWASLRHSLAALFVHVKGDSGALLPHLRLVPNLVQLSIASPAKGMTVTQDAAADPSDLPSRWLPHLPHLTYLDLACPSLLTDAFLDDLWQTDPAVASPSPDDERPSLIDSLTSFGLLLDWRTVSDAAVRRWRRDRCTRLQRACVQFSHGWYSTGGDMTDDALHERNDHIATHLVGAVACSRLTLRAEGLQDAFLREVGADVGLNHLQV